MWKSRLRHADTRRPRRRAVVEPGRAGRDNRRHRVVASRLRAETRPSQAPGSCCFPWTTERTDDWRPPQAITDQEGRFAFDRVAPGEYRLDVQKTGVRAAVQSSCGGPSQHDPGGRRSDRGRCARRNCSVAASSRESSGSVGRAFHRRARDGHAAGQRVRRRRAAAIRTRAHARLPAADQRRRGISVVSGLAAGEYYVAAMRGG